MFKVTCLSMMHVIDASAIILRKAIFKDMITIPEIIDEIKDEESKLYLELINLKIESAKEEFIEKVVISAKNTGDIDRLSDADIKLIAKALEVNGILVTDDYSIQNVARKLGIKYENVMQKGIEKEFKWIRVCRGCRKITDRKICEVCGSETYLKRVVKK